MHSIFERMIQTKRQELARRQLAVPLESLRDTIATLGRPRNFFNAVTRKPAAKRINVIAEIPSRLSAPAQGAGSFDPVSLARAYFQAGADALSVVTDDTTSTGSLDHIHAVRDAVKLPVMRRDVIFDPYQIYESRAAGADAVLLLAECLETGRLIDLQILATELNMTCVIEVRDMENLIRVRDAVIGFPHRSYSLLTINNRDLETDRADPGTTLRLAELVADRDVLISHGGIGSAADIRKLVGVGVRAVVLGEVLIKSRDIAATLRELTQ